MELQRFYEHQFEYVTNLLRKDIDVRYRYHNLNHTLDVIEQTQFIGKQEKLAESELRILRIAALFHDTGFLVKRAQHEMESIVFFEKTARSFGLAENDIALISGCIRATQMPQNPQSLIEQVMCDADLDYLGRNDFKPIGDLLYAEMNSCGEIGSVEEWNALQVRFLSKHQFHTHFSKTHRQPVLNQHLQALIQQSSEN
jgi:predicted metal-dependent HD superfamily phosphohydrolase